MTRSLASLLLLLGLLAVLPGWGGSRPAEATNVGVKAVLEAGFRGAERICPPKPGDEPGDEPTAALLPCQAAARGPRRWCPAPARSAETPRVAAAAYRARAPPVADVRA